MADIFDKIKKNRGPIGQYSKGVHGYFTFPKLEGELGNKMVFRGKECLVWSLNNYLGLANHPEVREADRKAAEQYGLAYPMGARMMTGQTSEHEKLENELADFMGFEDAILLNFGYQGMVSAIDCLVDRNDIIVYDSEAHACILDGMRLHNGKRFVFKHNDMESFDKQMNNATRLAETTGGGILVITEGVFGMAGDQGKLKEIVEFRRSGKYNFRLFVDDAHGFGTLGKTGQGAGEEQGVQNEIDVLFGTFAKSMASIGGFICADETIVEFMRYNMRSQMFAKALPMTITIGARKRLELLKTRPELKENLWTIANALKNGLVEAGFDIGDSNSPVTPVFMKGNLAEATNLTFDLRENHNIFCSIVIYPVVPKDVIMLRLIPTAAHTLEDVNYTVETFRKVKTKLDAGEYKSEEMAAVEVDNKRAVK
ncbi:MAG: aminotransferase class I/II-fold pyridoxal phosphate-dependent enzyme [Crocinitomicaceae bacterium]|jgi:glycine C-acetyltransferase|nr:aminotransferase class I/II-fold pyridoxal phosphate-dependent enzyme [Crocinitomicaceae bacterium]